MNDELLMVGEVARSLRVEQTTVRRWIKNGTLEAVKLPRCGKGKRQSYRVRASTLARILSGDTRESAEEP